MEQDSRRSIYESIFFSECYVLVTNRWTSIVCLLFIIFVLVCILKIATGIVSWQVSFQRRNRGSRTGGSASIYFPMFRGCFLRRAPAVCVGPASISVPCASQAPDTNSFLGGAIFIGRTKREKKQTRAGKKCFSGRDPARQRAVVARKKARSRTAIPGFRHRAAVVLGGSAHA